eukprot:3428040-Prymnesium_polylepis.1
MQRRAVHQLRPASTGANEQCEICRYGHGAGGTARMQRRAVHQLRPASTGADEQCEIRRYGHGA